ncbi:MAG TPA: hypothetical protein VGH75_08300, partial [Steroidobacteraceae bacterium]
MPSDGRSLWESITASGFPAGRLYGIAQRIPLADLANATSLGGRLEELRDESVVLLAWDQLTAALALIELDGVARRMVLCPPDVKPEHLPAIMQDAEAGACVIDQTGAFGSLSFPTVVRAGPELTERDLPRQRSRDTEWVLLTSG